MPPRLCCFHHAASAPAVIYSLRGTSPLHRCSPQRLTSVVISLRGGRLFDTVRPLRSTRINGSVVPTHLRAGKLAGNGHIYPTRQLLFSVISCVIVSGRLQAHPPPVRKTGLSRLLCVRLARCVRSIAPGDQTEAAFRWLFLSSDRLLLVRPAPRPPPPSPPVFD